MKKIISTIVFCLLTSVASATIINGGFENGLTGWNVSLDYYADGDGGRLHNPLPKEEVFHFMRRPPSVVTDLGGLESVEGNYAGRIYNDQGIEVFFIDGKEYEYNIPTVTLSQNVQMSVGDKLTGFMSFGTGDWPGYADRSYVSINNVPILSLDLQDAYDLSILPEGRDRLTPWVYWSWTAPKTELYTLSLNVSGDDDLDSWAYFDNIQQEHVSIPEPSAAILLGLGIVTLFVSMSIVQAHRKV